MEKISLANYKNVMSESEMKMVKGGACPEGKNEYYCVGRVGDTIVTSGSVCASGAASARVALATAYVEDNNGVPTIPTVTCS